MSVDKEIKEKDLTKCVNCAKIEQYKDEIINALKQITGGKRKLEAILKQ